MIDGWIQYWEKDLLDKPKELVLGSEYLLNILPQAIVTFEDWQNNNSGKTLQRSEKSSVRKLAALLERAVREDPVANLMALEYPTELAALRRFLSAGTYDLAGIIPLLRTLRYSPSSQTLRSTLVEELDKGKDADRQTLGAIAVAMARRSVGGNFTDGKLQEFLKRALAEEGTFILIEDHLEELKASEYLHNQASIVACDLLYAIVHSPVVENTLDGEARDLFDLFNDDQDWRHLAYYLLNRMSRLWATALEPYVRVDGDATDAIQATRDLLQHEEELRGLGVTLIREYVARVFQRILQMFTSQSTHEPEPHIAEAGHAVASFLEERGVFTDRQHPGRHDKAMYGTPYRALYAMALSLQIDTTYALADHYIMQDQEFVSGLASKVGRRLTELLADEPNAIGPGAAYLSAGENLNEPETICFDWSARKAVRVALGDILAPLSTRLLEYTGSAADALDRGELSLGEEFWDTFAKYFARATTKPNYIPWDRMNKALLQRVITRLFDQMEGSEGKHLVIFRIGDLDPRSMGWRIGSVAFYDPAIFDYGEGRYLRNKESTGGSFVHAAVRVSVRSRVEARQRARGSLEEALSCLSFGLSVNRKGSGYRPTVVEGGFVMDLTNPGYLYGSGTRLQHSHTIQYADVVEAPRRAKAYDRLLHSESGQSLNELQEGFLKAVRWYREARWEEDPAQRFALYWISLEHIFASGQQGKQKGIYEDLPALQMTWRDLGRALLPLSFSLQAVWTAIESDEDLDVLVAGCAELENWDRDERILLDPDKVKTLIDLTPDDKKDAKKRFKDYLIELEQLASQSHDIQKYVVDLRERQWFKLYLLYDLRNKMFHEAIYDNERLPYLADEIADVADAVLVKVAEEATSPDPECATVEELIQRFGNHPWETP